MAYTAAPYHDEIPNREVFRRIRRSLDGNGLQTDWGLQIDDGHIKASAVLFLLTLRPPEEGQPAEPCLVLNKRSRRVLQPGDLCCPGGGIASKDRLLSYALHWPFSPLQKWPTWKRWKRTSYRSARRLSLLLATALRESWEEMHLNPFKVAFMGPLPSQKLVLFRREIYPLVGWVSQRQPLAPNWEVERIVHLPLRKLVQEKHYARYRLSFDTPQEVNRRNEDFPCFVHYGRGGKEILWGATFRITMDFLKLVFGFDLPDLRQAPVIYRQLDETYLSGSNAHPLRALQKETGKDF